MPAMSQTVSNPVIPGFNSDPCMCVVGDTYYIAASSFHIFPGMPIYASKDLVTWSHVGNALNRRDQQIDLSLSTATLIVNRDGHTLVATGGLYAPTLRYHKGVFYITCTNARWANGEVTFQNFIMTTTDILSNNWSNPIFFDFHGIDPCIFFDNDDRVYIQGSRVIDYSIQPATTIDQFEIDVKTGKKLSEQKTIWGGAIEIDTEGPQVYKRGPWYYLVAAEGGTFEHHQVSVARSKSIWGPYETSKTNPILPPTASTSYIQQTGHPDFFQDCDGEWWAVLLGVRHHKNGGFPIGRETCLTRVSWPTEDDWPVISPVQSEIQIPKFKNASADTKPLPSLPIEKIFLEIRNGPAKPYKSSGNGRTLTLVASQADLSDSINAPSFVGLRQRKLSGTADVSLDLSDQRLKAQQVSAGLTLYKDENLFLDVHYQPQTSSIVFRFRNHAKKLERSKEYPITAEAATQIQLRIQYTEESYEALYRLGDANEWASAGLIDSSDISNFDFTGPLIGVFATSPASDVEVTFKSFAVDL